MKREFIITVTTVAVVLIGLLIRRESETVEHGDQTRKAVEFDFQPGAGIVQRTNVEPYEPMREKVWPSNTEVPPEGALPLSNEVPENKLIRLPNFIMTSNRIVIELTEEEMAEYLRTKPTPAQIAAEMEAEVEAFKRGELRE